MQYKNELYKKLDLVPGDFVIEILSDDIYKVEEPRFEEMVCIIAGTQRVDMIEEAFLDEYKPLQFKVSDVIKLSDRYIATVGTVISDISDALNYKIKSVEHKETHKKDKFSYNLEGQEGHYTLNAQGTSKWFPGISVFELVQSRSGRVSLPTIDMSKYPHTCQKCGAPAYIGAVRVECSKCGEY